MAQGSATKERLRGYSTFVEACREGTRAFPLGWSSLATGLVLPVFLLGSCRPGPSADRPTTGDRPSPPLRYQAEFELTERGQKRFARVLQDGARFRVEHRHRSDSPGPHRIELHDGGDPHLVLEYHPDRNLAMPTLESNLRAFGAAITTLGRTEAYRRYQVPVTYREPGSFPPELKPDPRLERWVQRDGDASRSVGTARVAGRPCQIREQTLRGSPSTTLVTTRSWVCSATELVLRRETFRSFGEASPIPPIRSAFRVTRLELDPPRNPLEFQVPAGSQVRLPTIFSHVRMPERVSMAPFPRRASGIGIVF
ncbi:MAG: hypothetical protein FJX77_14155 [Armatimonadetes bacterium]|nr:hypothetical protein [Armatimonadota bacterium]